MIAWVALPVWRARGPRFILSLMIVWIGLRAMANWAESRPMPILATPQQSAKFPAIPPQRVEASRLSVSWDEAIRAARSNGSKEYAQNIRSIERADAVGAIGVATASAETAAPPAAAPFWSGSDRHRWRFAMMAAMLKGRSQEAAALGSIRNAVHFPSGEAARPPTPHWPTPAAGRWSLSAYSYWRAATPEFVVLAGDRPATLGGSQTAVRADYRIDRDGRFRAFARLSATSVGRGGADLALGVAVRPLRELPIDVHIEHRLALAGSGRDRTLIYAAGGIDQQPLPHGFRLSAYGQGGLAGPRSPEAFVDAALAIQRPVIESRGFTLSLGAIVAGAAQSDVSRVDIGPRAAAHLPLLGQGASIALDWRERIAGTARPGSGVALTLAAGF